MYCRQFLSAFAITLICSFVMPALPAHAQETEVWDVEFTGKGDPRDVGFKGHGINSSTTNLYDKFTNNDVLPGWMTASGNPGGRFYREPEDRLTKAAGWTAEWRLAVERVGQGLALNFNDDTSLVKVIYDAPANTVTLEDYLIGLDGNSESVSVSVELGDRAVHIYRVVRQPGSPTVEFYIDNATEAAASIAPWPAADHGDAAQLQRVVFAHSALNAAWDYFRYHSSATTPAAVPATKDPAIDLPRESRDGYRTYVISPAINNSAILEDRPLPAVCRDEKVMKVLCARGEYEPASFLIQTDKPLETVMVRVGDLVGPAGVLRTETVDVRIAQKFYRLITWQCVAIPWVLVHDPGMLEIVDKHQKWVTEMTEESWKSPGGALARRIQGRLFQDESAQQRTDRHRYPAAGGHHGFSPVLADRASARGRQVRHLPRRGDDHRRQRRTNKADPGSDGAAVRSAAAAVRVQRVLPDAIGTANDD